MKEQTKNILIALFVLLACFLALSIIFFLKPSVGDGKETLHVCFSNVSKINKGTRVTFAGKPVGQVVSITPLPHPQEQPTDALGRLYCYKLLLKIDSHVKVYTSDEITLQTLGLLGEKAININPKPPLPGVALQSVADQLLYANCVDPIENSFQEISHLSNKLGDTMNLLIKWIDDNEGKLSYAVSSFGSAMTQIEKTFQTVNDKALVAELATTLAQTRALLEEVEKKEIVPHVGVLVENLKQVSQDLADGKGTLGSLIQKEDLYLGTKAIMSKIDSLINSMNQYGLLFHLNKHWQRTHAKRLTQLEALQNPLQFKTYFEKEVDQVNNALTHLSLLIEKAEEKNDEMVKSPLFQKQFSEFLRKCEELADNVKLCNQQWVDAQNSAP